MKDLKPIPESSEELKAQCNDENQFSNFERVFRNVMSSAPKAEVLKRGIKKRSTATHGCERGKKGSKTQWRT